MSTLDWLSNQCNYITDAGGIWHASCLLHTTWGQRSAAEQMAEIRGVDSPTLRPGAGGPGCPAPEPGSWGRQRQEQEQETSTRRKVKQEESGTKPLQRQIQGSTGSSTGRLTLTWCCWSSCPDKGVWWIGSWTATPAGWTGQSPGLRGKDSSEQEGSDSASSSTDVNSLKK